MTAGRGAAGRVSGRHTAGWELTTAHVRAIVLGGGGALAAVVSHRIDLLVLAVPFLVVASWGALTRPRDPLGVRAHLGNDTLAEGQAIRWTATLEIPAHADETTVRLSPGAFVEEDPATDRSAVRRPGDGTSTERVIPARVTRWGRRRIGPGLVAARSPWWAYRTPVIEVGAFDVVVTPATTTFDAHAPTPQPEGIVGVHRAGRLGSGSEFATIRPFQVGDRLRRIHWPASQRTGTLQVRTTHADADAHVVLVVDAFSDLGPREGIDGRPTSLDLTVRSAAAVAQHYLGSGDRVSLRVLGSDGPARLPAGSGPGQRRRVLDVLARITPAADRDLATVAGVDGLSSGSLVVIFTPLVHHAMAAVVARTASRGLTTIVVDTLPTHLGADADDPFLSLAWRIRRLDRQDELHRLRTAGVPVVPWHGPGSLDLVLRDLGARARSPRLVRR